MFTNFQDVNRRLANFFLTGRDITANQIRSRFGITNVSARITELRAAGYPIYSDKKLTGNGNTIRVYRLGTPTRATIVAGYYALKHIGYANYIVSNRLQNLV